MNVRTSAVAGLGALLALLACVSAAAGPPQKPGSPPGALPPPYFSGLNNPRGLTFGPDGALYVAEGGTGGDTQTLAGPNESETEPCMQVPMAGPYKGGLTSRISRISGGVRTTVAGDLPSSITSEVVGSQVSGVADVKFIGQTLYAIEAGAGCSHGLSGTENALLRVNRDGTTTAVADLSAFQRAHPVASPEPDDYEPDGTWYSMVTVGDDIYAVEPNHGEIDRIDTRTGAIDRLIDISASQGHVVPTALAVDGAHFFVGNLWHFPIEPGQSNIWRVDRHGKIKLLISGLTTVLALVPGRGGRFYVLESMTAAGFPGPGEAGTGTIVSVDRSGKQTVVATGLTTPGGMTMGPDGALYVSNFSFGAPPGLGQILRIPVPR
jgi:hypothetical protein